MRTRLILSALGVAALATSGVLATSASAADVPGGTYKIVNSQSEQCVHGWTTGDHQVDLVPCDYPVDATWNVEQPPGARGYFINLAGTQDCITTPPPFGRNYLLVENCLLGRSRAEWNITESGPSTAHITPVNDPAACMTRSGPLVTLTPCTDDNNAQDWTLVPTS